MAERTDGQLPVKVFLADQVVRRSPRAPASPLVSVVLPTHARAHGGLLERAMASVLSQDADDLELIVVDDGSTDGSEELIAAAAERDPRLVHVRHESNSGLPALRVNEGIELARGRYLAFQFDDDAWRAGALSSLLETARAQNGPAVVVGRSRLKAEGGEWTLPMVSLDLVNLYQQNRLTNNSVLLPRSLLETFGMFDCHIGMRRLCDWDLWLRLIRHVPFQEVDALVSDVVDGNPGAIGKTVPWDLPLFRFIHDIPRNALLTPALWHEYRVDSLEIGDVELDRDIRRRLYEEQIVPFYLRCRHRFPQVEGFPATLPRPPRSVLCALGPGTLPKDLGWASPSGWPGGDAIWFEPAGQVLPRWTADARTLVLAPPVEDQALELAVQAQQAGIPSCLLIDTKTRATRPAGSERTRRERDRILSMLKEQVDVAWCPRGADDPDSDHPRRVPVPGAGGVPEEVREDGDSLIRAQGLEAALRAAEIHHRTRSRRHPDGRPRIGYVFPPSECASRARRLLRHIGILRTYGIQPLLVLPRGLEWSEEAREMAQELALTEGELEFFDSTCADRPEELAGRWVATAEALEFLDRRRPALVHSLGLNASFGEACAARRIPHVVSLPGGADSLDGSAPAAGPAVFPAEVVHSDSARGAVEWGRALGLEAFCARTPVPEEALSRDRTRDLRGDAGTGTLRVLVTAAPSTSRREAAGAVRLLRAEGIGFEAAIGPRFQGPPSEDTDVSDAEGLEAGDIGPDGLEGVDVLLSLPDPEGPPFIEDAMAAGVVVVATDSGTAAELVVHGQSGFLCSSSAEELAGGLRRALTLDAGRRAEMLERARRVAASECHPWRTARDLLSSYARAIERAAPELQEIRNAVAEAPVDVVDTARMVRPPHAPGSHVPLRTRLRYTVQPTADDWMGIDLFVGTHETQPRGALELALLSGEGRPVRQVSVDLSTARDNQWLSFRFEPIANASGRPFEVALQLRAPRHTRLSVYEANPFEGRTRRALRRLGLPLRGNTLHYRSWHRGEPRRGID